MTTITINGIETQVPAGAIAYKYADPTEGARWVHEESDLADIRREDPSLIVEVPETLADLDLYEARAFAELQSLLDNIIDVRRGDGDTIAVTSIEDDGEGSGDVELEQIRAALGSGYTAEWTGDGNTDEDGVTTSDVRIERVAS